MNVLGNMNIFVVNNEDHVLTYGNLDSTERTSLGVSIRDFLTGFETEDPTWDDVIP